MTKATVHLLDWPSELGLRVDPALLRGKLRGLIRSVIGAGVVRAQGIGAPPFEPPRTTTATGSDPAQRGGRRAGLHGHPGGRWPRLYATHPLERSNIGQYCTEKER